MAAPGTSLMVRHLSEYVRADDLRMEAEKFGDVRDVYIPKDFHTKRPKGLAFIEFQDAISCEDALTGLEGLELEGQQISVNMAREGRKKPDDFRGGRGYGRDGRRGGGRYDDRRGGYDDRRGGSDDRRGGGYDDRRGGYNDRRYDNDRDGPMRRGGYDDRRGGGGRGGGDDRRGGYEDRRGGYDDRRGGGGYDSRRGGRGDYDDAPGGMRGRSEHRGNDVSPDPVRHRSPVDDRRRSRSPADMDGRRERDRGGKFESPPRERSPAGRDDRGDSLDPPAERPARDDDDRSP